MSRIALAAALLFAGFGVGAGFSAYAQQPYDPIYTPASKAVRAEQAALVGFDQFKDTYITTGVFGTVLMRHGTSDWQQMDIPTSVLLTSVDIIDDDYIWAAGHDGVLLQSTDGGQTWQHRLDGTELLNMEYPWLQARIAEIEAEIDSLEDADEIDELEFTLEELGFLMQGLDIQFEVGPTKPFLDVLFLDRSTGFALAAYGTLLKTINGGDSWQILNDRIDNPAGYHLNKLLVTDDNILFLLGEYGLLSRSDDLGESWDALDTPYDGSFFGGVIDQSGQLWIFGLRGNVFKSADNGESFHAVNVPTRYNLNNGTVLGDGRLVFVGQSGVIVVIEPSTEQAVVYSHESSVPLMGVRQGAGNELILVGRSGLQSFIIPNGSTGIKG
ncbi:WD40/YVTN/BNR-like repeat-containing protein [Aliidiomarina quisquiliarum]|uniref:WD40/YVTN/BNR-like repeat-containing protein n=1 Tax=Aliidiomarina quisquiliarum TaxID=2938947 RepID=UPI00208F19F6|nr:YCF48-related protein [Aliidiomarina quisquiliarum]MCO4320872.1 YCF48-related protein [Aliidiomarina quisquiliarum]